jgi:hypothetical protein
MFLPIVWRVLASDYAGRNDLAKTPGNSGIRRNAPASWGNSLSIRCWVIVVMAAGKRPVRPVRKRQISAPTEVGLQAAKMVGGGSQQAAWANFESIILHGFLTQSMFVSSLLYNGSISFAKTTCSFLRPMVYSALDGSIDLDNRQSRPKFHDGGGTSL